MLVYIKNPISKQRGVNQKKWAVLIKLKSTHPHTPLSDDFKVTFSIVTIPADAIYECSTGIRSRMVWRYVHVYQMIMNSLFICV